MSSLRLLLLRHAEAEEPRGKPDHGRRLTERGVKDAARFAAARAREGFACDAIVTSDGVRARQTAEALTAALGMEVVVDGTLYLTGVKAIGAALSKAAPAARSVVVVGHNPGWSDAVSVLAGEELVLGTCEAALLEVEAGDWGEAFDMAGAWAFVSHLRDK
jgi:phosphohistidine phosphatase